MANALYVLYLATGLVALYLGADWLVRGGSALAVRLGVTPLLVGLTVVAYGTSTPELVVSALAAAKGQGDIALGNVVGSNLFNIGVILGLTALVCPLCVRFQLFKLDVPVMIGVALLFLAFFLDGSIALWEALVLLALVVIYTVVNVRLARRQGSREIEREFDDAVSRPASSAWKEAGLIVAGLTTLIVGSRLFVTGAVDVARIFKVSEAIIGLTIVAGGTSLPELASSLMAAWRRQPDIAVGNVIGSNIYNILAIAGVSGALFPPLAGSGVSLMDVWVMIGFSLVLLAIAWTGFKLHRWEGVLLLGLYGGYLWYRWPNH